MSSASHPISPARFAAALESLSVSSLYLKVAELQNSIAHLRARAFREKQRKEKEERELQEQDEQEPEGRRMGLLHVGPSQFERNIKQQRQLRLNAITKQAEEKEARAREDEVKLASGEWVRTPSGTQIMKPHQTTYVDIFGREQVSRWKDELEKAYKKSQTKFKDEEEMLAATTVVCPPLSYSPFVGIVA